MTDYRCKIWTEFKASQALRTEDLVPSFYVLDSPRAGGSYWIDAGVAKWCESSDDINSQRVKARISTWVIDNQREVDNAPRVTRDLFRRKMSSRDLSVPERCERLLRKLGSYSIPIIDITQSAGTVLELLAWSESVEISELTHLISILQSSGYVIVNGHSISVTEAGYQRIQEMDLDTKPRIGF